MDSNCTKKIMQFLRSLVFVMLMVSSFWIWESSSSEGPRISKNITVSLTGQADFKTINEAIERGVPENNNLWIHILVMPGIYTEKVTVPQNKPFIIIEGTSKDKTTVNWNGNSDVSNAALVAMAPNFVARRITFKNTYNHEYAADANERKPAVASAIYGDKIAFYDCGFIGVQDTLFDCCGRHYFKNCYIEGSVDFIFGNGASIYEGCKINVTAGLTGAIPGYITAQGRKSSHELSGFIFKSCNIFGTGPAYLGRAYGSYSRVIYYKCYISNIVVPEGWDAWGSKGKEGSLTYVELDNTGPGSDTTKRVPWRAKLNANEVEKLLSMFFFESGRAAIERWL